jgi:hypothetical protein
MAAFRWGRQGSAADQSEKWQQRVNKEVVSLARRPKEYIVKVTHRYVHNPEAVERGLELWATYLAEHLSRRLAEEARAKKNEQPLE